MSTEGVEQQYLPTLRFQTNLQRCVDFSLDTHPDAQEIRRLRLSTSGKKPGLTGIGQEHCCGQRETSPDEDVVLGDGVLVRALNECC